MTTYNVFSNGFFKAQITDRHPYFSNLKGLAACLGVSADSMTFQDADTDGWVDTSVLGTPVGVQVDANGNYADDE